MKTKHFFLIMFLGLFPFFLSAQVKQDSTLCILCEQLKSLKLPDVTILEVKVTEEGHCRVLGRISKEINFELLLPEKWNHRFLMGGGGGFVGYIENEFRYSVNLGFANAGTDTGHEGSILLGDWALNNMERQLNFGRLAIHRTATVSKAIINAYYCSYPLYSYFLGISTGGGQGLIEAQLYPEDFDGIVAGDPSPSWPAFAAKYIYNTKSIFPDPKNLNNPILTPDNIRILHYYILEQCDDLDGLKDSIINDPRDCKFDFSALPVCPDDNVNKNCFTSKQIAAIKLVYAPIVVQKDTIYPALPFGGENEIGGWNVWITGSDTSWGFHNLQFNFGNETFKYLVFNDPNWDYTKYDFTNYFKDTQYASSYLDATSSDYRQFHKRGGKMIIVHGWNDMAESAFSVINHYKAIEKMDPDVRSYIRLFLLSGVLHWQGGSGPDQADWIKIITEWVEKNEAPERVVVSKVKNKQVIMTRPVYPFPEKAKYDGKGNPNLENSFLLVKDK